MKLCYIAGRYRAETPEAVELNIRAAEFMGKLVAEKGYYPVIPHANTRNFERLCNAPDEFYLDGTLELMKACEYVLMIPGWRESSGARNEHDVALEKGLFVYYSIEDLPKQKGRGFDGWHQY